MIMQIFDEPKEELMKEIQKQNDRLDRIKKAYIDGAFNLKKYNAKKKIVEETLTNLQNELEETNCCEELKFTPQDILLKRDIDYINRVKLKIRKELELGKIIQEKKKPILILVSINNIS